MNVDPGRLAAARSAGVTAFALVVLFSASTCSRGELARLVHQRPALAINFEGGGYVAEVTDPRGRRWTSTEVGLPYAKGVGFTNGIPKCLTLAISSNWPGEPLHGQRQLVPHLVITRPENGDYLIRIRASSALGRGAVAGVFVHSLGDSTRGDSVVVAMKNEETRTWRILGGRSDSLSVGLSEESPATSADP